MTANKIIFNIGELITFESLAKEQRFTDITEKDLGRKKNAWVACENGKIVKVGEGEIAKEFYGFEKIDAKGKLVTPGLVDAHTHPIFAGDRSQEFGMKLAGATYQEVAANGGGIRSTMKATREASDEELLSSVVERLKAMSEHGVTTVEVKSGYGLNVKEELRLLRILQKAKKQVPQTLHVTCLALHAASPETKSLKEYADQCTKELLPKLFEEKLCDSVDAFIEEGYFLVDDVREFFTQAKKLGFGVRIHADEFSNAKAALFAAEIGAQAADHLQHADEIAIKKMANAGTVAVLLPGTSLCSKIPFVDGRKFVNANCAVALATDFNPGSCMINNLPLIASVGAVQCHLTLAQTFAAVTIVAAKSLGLGKSKGAIVSGYDADLVVWSDSTLESWITGFGSQKKICFTFG